MEVVEPMRGESEILSLEETSSCESGVRECLGGFFFYGLLSIQRVGKKKKKKRCRFFFYS